MTFLETVSAPTSVESYKLRPPGMKQRICRLLTVFCVTPAQVAGLNCLLGNRTSLSSHDFVGKGQKMESNARYYRRRAIEERMAAQRAVTEQARTWHAKLAKDFAERADSSPSFVNA